MGPFRFTGGDGTTVVGWRSYDLGAPRTGIPVLISNGLGTPPTAWPSVIAPGSGFDVATWYYRGTGGGERPADPSHVRIDDHVGDALALMDHEGIDRALVACWSMGVNIGFELAEEHADRVAGLLAVAGVPGGTFRAMFGPLRVPQRFRHDLGVAAARVGYRIGPQLTWVSRHIPLNRVTSNMISHSGFVFPGAKPERLIPALREFREHDFRWYFRLAIGASEHHPMDLSFVTVPTTLVAGRYDVITSMHDMVEAASRIPHAELHLLSGSHFLPLEFPDELAAELNRLAERTDLGASSGAASQHH